MRRRAGRGVALVAVLGVAVAACGAGDTGGNGGPILPTPQASWSAVLRGTVALVTDAIAAINGQLFAPVSPYRPSEPPSLTQAARVVLQVQSADPDQGYVMIYELPDISAASAAGRDLAAYLGSGFGQTNFPTDAQFSVTQVGATVVFTWWAGSRASDPDAARAAFDAIRAVGLTIPVVK